MSKKRVVAEIVAVLDGPNGEGSQYISLGPLWLTDKGTLSGRIEVEPIAWKDPKVLRNVIVSPRQGVKITVVDVRAGKSETLADREVPGKG